MEKERLYQEYIYNKFKDTSVSAKTNKIALMEECQKFKVNYTDIYVKIVNYQIYTYGTQLGDNNCLLFNKQLARKILQNEVHRKRYRKNREYLDRLQQERNNFI